MTGPRRRPFGGERIRPAMTWPPRIVLMFSVLMLLIVPVACAALERPVPAPKAPLPRSLPRESASPIAHVEIPPEVKDEDFLYLEEITGEKALAFARAHNSVSEGELTAHPEFRALEERLFSIYSSTDRIPWPDVAHDRIRNFWTDAEHPRGLWRQTTLSDYRKAKPSWTVLIDVDALGREENESYVWGGSTCLHPLYRKCLVRLSKGGSDAVIVREFDVSKKAFVKGGFTLPEAKSRVAWKDANTIYVGTDFGPGSLTKAGYPRTAREWKRGTLLAAAPQIFEVGEENVSGGCYREFDHGLKRDFCARKIDTERSEISWLRDGKLTKIDKPDDAVMGTWKDEMLLRPRTDWTVDGVTYAKGSLLVTNLERFVEGKREFQVLFTPTPQTSLYGWSGTKTRLLINVLSDVRNQVTIFSREEKRWSGTPLKESAGAIGAWPFDWNDSDDVWLSLEDFTVPSSLLLWNTPTGRREPLKQSPSFYDATNVEVAQHFATSKDGTRVPYFEVGRKDRAGPGPTLLEAYGGFEISLLPGYSSKVGAAWIERGGVYVLGNLRGGGEYGPGWHHAAMKHERQNAYDDLIAIAEDLVRRGVTTPKLLGVMGGSNGGLLTSVMLTQRPDLFGAIVSKAPLTDMQRYHKLLAGASWVGEFGDPDNPEDWAALSKFSPFHNVKRGAAYPPVFFTTSTRDDRVHPGHARKMVVKLDALGHTPLYYENIEGGHGGAADIKQRAYVDALIFTFLRTRLGLAGEVAKP